MLLKTEVLEKILVAKKEILFGNKYKDNLGWLYLPKNKQLVNAVKEIAEEYREKSDVLVLIGTGGSYLGAKAAIEAFENPYDKEKEVLYLGNNLSRKDLQQKLDYLEDKDFTVNFISKSGGTFEPAIAFKYILELLFKKYSEEEVKERILITTGNEELERFCLLKGYDFFPIPEDVGGRYSVLSAVGLFPMAYLNIDIEALLKGAEKALDDFLKDDMSLAEIHAGYRNTVSDKEVELLVNYEPHLESLGKWMQQLFSESEGKDGKGLIPMPISYSTDLHSIGQMIQEGKKVFIETHISFYDENYLAIPNVEFDGIKEELIYGEKGFNELNKDVKDSVIKAHSEADIPHIDISFNELNETNLGYFMQSMMISCALSSIIIGVNPFNQPGVEMYKSNLVNKLSL